MKEKNDATEETKQLFAKTLTSSTISPKVSPKIYISTLIACISCFQFGWLVPQLNVHIYNTNCGSHNNEQCVFYPGHSSFEYVSASTAWIVGAGFGSFISAYPSDFYGRRRTIIGNSFVIILGALIQTIAPSIYFFSFGRLISGTASGVGFTVSVYYISEIAPPHIRGILTTFVRFPLVMGILCGNLIAFEWGTAEHWRYIMAFPILIGAFQISLSYYMIESPRWLILNGRLKKNKIVQPLSFEQEQTVSLKDTNDESENTNTIIQPEPIDAKCQSLDKVTLLQCESDSITPNLSILLSREYRWQFFISAGLQSFQQFSGVSAVFLYGFIFFQEAGIKDTRMVNVIIALVNVFSTIFSLSIIDHFSRRGLLIFSILGMLLMNIAITIGLIYSLSYFSIFATCGYVLIYQIGISPISMLISGEIFPAFLRAYASSVCRIFYWSSNLVVGVAFIYVNEMLGNYCFLPFFATNVLALVFSWLLVPETKNKMLEEIEEELRCRAVGKTLKSIPKI